MLTTEKKGYTLRYDFNAYCDYEDRFPGRTLVGDIMKPGFAPLRALVWAGLVEEHKITLREAGEIVEGCIENGMTATDIRAEIINALNESNFMKRLNATAAEQTIEKKNAKEKEQETSFMS